MTRAVKVLHRNRACRCAALPGGDSQGQDPRERTDGVALDLAVPGLYFDGQLIDVLWDNYDNAVAWFERYFQWGVLRREGWKVDPACVKGQMTQMNYGTWLVTYLTESRLPHHFAERGTAEAHVRVCFRTRELDTLYETFFAGGVRVSPVYDGPKARYFDVWATPEGIRLTLQEDQTLEASAVYPSWTRIGVRDVTKAIEWYQAVTGMRLIERDPDNRFAVLALKVNHSDDDSLWVLERLPENASTDPRSGQVQPVCWIKSRDDFFQYHKDLQRLGVKTSNVGGFLARGMVSFHFYDPDGNRFNVSSM